MAGQAKMVAEAYAAMQRDDADRAIAAELAQLRNEVSSQGEVIAEILALLESGRTSGGETLTSSKHAAAVIRRDIINAAKGGD